MKYKALSLGEFVLPNQWNNVPDVRRAKKPTPPKESTTPIEKLQTPDERESTMLETSKATAPEKRSGVRQTEKNTIPIKERSMLRDLTKLENKTSEDSIESRTELLEPQTDYLQTELSQSVIILNESVNLLHEQTRYMLKEQVSYGNAHEYFLLREARANVHSMAAAIQVKINLLNSMRRVNGAKSSKPENNSSA